MTSASSVFLSLLLFFLSFSSATETTPVNFSAPLQRPYCLTVSSTSSTLSVDPCEVNISIKDRASFNFSSRSLRAVASYSLNTSTSGWDFFEVVPDVSSSLYDGYYFAGFMEGFLTFTNLTQINTTSRTATIAAASTQVLDFITDHISWMNESVSKKNATSIYWQRVGMILNQIQGMTDGYNLAAAAAAGGSAQASFTDMFLNSFYFELFDVQEKFGASFSFDSSRSRDDDDAIAPAPFKNSHCSAIVKLTADDLLVAHTSWFRFENMRRIFKTYHFDTSVAFSSYVGFVHSGDDWYMNYPSQLAVFETSLAMYNSSLVRSSGTTSSAVSEFIRVMAANYLSSTTDDWGRYFSMHNNGCYNNMFVAADWKLFAPSTTPVGTMPVLAPKTVQIYEQIPGKVVTTDVSNYINQNGFFASYNVAYDDDIWREAGYASQYEKYGDFFSYQNTTRGLIFRRNQSSCTSVEDVQRLIRYNNYKADPLSRIPNCAGTATPGVCTPAFSANAAIACRGDLAPVGNESQLGPLYRSFRRGDLTAYDAKVASYKNRETLTAVIISGPPTSHEVDDLPPFSFSANRHLFPAGATIPPLGLPDTWNFPWIAKSPACPSCVTFNKKSTKPSGEPDGGTKKLDLWGDKQSVGGMIGGVLGLCGVAMIALYLRRTRHLHPTGRGGTNRYHPIEDGGK